MKLMKSKLKASLKCTLVKRNKYGNIPVNGFDSQSEYRRWCTLTQMRDSGKITELRHHVPFKFLDGKIYEADFVYLQDNITIVEDVKNPMLLHGNKFIANKMKMKLHYGLTIRALHPKTHTVY